MTDKEKIRKEVERIQLYTQSDVLKQILDYINSLQEEPVSDIEAYQSRWGKSNGYLAEPVSEDLEEAAKLHVIETRGKDVVWDENARCAMLDFKAGTKWQKAKEESKTEDLGEYINELSKQFPEVSFSKILLSNYDVPDLSRYRAQAAIAAMQGVMNFFGSIDYNRETIAKLAVEQADALIEELKKK